MHRDVADLGTDTPVSKPPRIVRQMEVSETSVLDRDVASTDLSAYWRGSGQGRYEQEAIHDFPAAVQEPDMLLVVDLADVLLTL